MTDSLEFGPHAGYPQQLSRLESPLIKLLESYFSHVMSPSKRFIFFLVGRLTLLLPQEIRKHLL